MSEPEATRPLIAMRDVHKIYGQGNTRVQALAGVSFEVMAGEFVAVMGPSGSGKSTCMNIVGCLDAPTSGSYKFAGVEVSGMGLTKQAMLRRQYIGFVFQSFNLLARTDALTNVALPLTYKGVARRDRKRLAAEALQSVGLGGRLDHTPAQLSGGQQQRVAIARALVTSPNLVLADEPTGNLDTKTSVEIMELLKQLNRESGITIMMVTHEPETAAHARRILTFVDGALVGDAPPEQAS